MYNLMFSRYKVLLCVIAVLLIWQGIKFIPWLQPLKTSDIDHGPAASGVFTPVLVSVFYEALCPDSKNFIVRQLLPTVNKASRLLTVSLIPYGKAKTEETASGNISFTCQHGPTECLANKIHACAISKIPNSNLLIKYISCMISDNMIPELIGESCARELDINWKQISQCTYSEEGSLLLKKYGALTDALNPALTFVPTVLLDNVSDGKPMAKCSGHVVSSFIVFSAISERVRSWTRKYNISEVLIKGLVIAALSKSRRSRFFI